MTEKLKPCPFCGSEQVDIFDSWAEQETKIHWVNVECIDCGAQGASKKGNEAAIAAWNNRSTSLQKAYPEIFSVVSEYVNSSICLHCRELKATARDLLKLYK